VIKDAEEAPQKSLEDSFTETMNAIDEFVADCDDLVSDFDKIASRMQDGNVSFDSD
jgi:soluble cytochrome b562